MDIAQLVSLSFENGRKKLIFVWNFFYSKNIHIICSSYAFWNAADVWAFWINVLTSAWCCVDAAGHSLKRPISNQIKFGLNSKYSILLDKSQQHSSLINSLFSLFLSTSIILHCERQWIQAKLEHCWLNALQNGYGYSPTLPQIFDYLFERRKKSTKIIRNSEWHRKVLCAIKIISYFSKRNSIAFATFSCPHSLSVA